MSVKKWSIEDGQRPLAVPGVRPGVFDSPDGGT